MIQQIDHTGTDEERSHDRRAVYEAGIDSLKIIHKCDRRLILHVPECIRIDHGDPCCVLDPLIGSAGDQIREKDDKQHDNK